MLRKLFRLSMLSAASVVLSQLPSFAYQVDKVNHVVNVTPGASPSATTADLRGALSYLASRSDSATTWTLKFAPGQYILSAQIGASGLKNTILSSDPARPAKLIKMPGWSSSSSGEYILSLRMASNLQLIGMEFYGQTNFANNANPYWPDQGVYVGSSKVVKLDRNKFYNFGNAALRLVTDSRDPVPGVNCSKLQVSNNLFNNIYQTATTSTDKIHGGIAQSTWNNNTFVNVRGAIKFASRTPGANYIEFVSNQVNGGDHYGLEIDNYNHFTIKNNSFQNIKEYAMTIYTSGDAARMAAGFPWGDNFTIAANTIRNVGFGIRYDHRPFFDGTQNIPKNLVIDGNTLTQVTSTLSYTPAITVTGGKVDGLKLTNNKFSQITNRNYMNVISGSTNVTIQGNTADGVAIAPKVGALALK